MNASLLTVPFVWRRYVGAIRALLAAACAFLHLIVPIPGSYLFASLAGLYAAYAVALIFRDKAEKTLYPLALLYLDAGFFFLCLLHPSRFALGLSLAAYLYVLCFASLFYSWPQVTTVVAAVAGFLCCCLPWR
ncbi:MAG: hypothetical protein WKF37_07030 [Bryobacteraceae bacterium]